jgi:hypothetical protein
MVRSYTLYSVTLRRLLLSAPLLIALSAPLAAQTQVQKTEERLEHAAKAVDTVTQGSGAARGGIHGDVTGGLVGWASDGKGGYVLAEAGKKDKKQQQLTQQEREREREREKERIERKKDKHDDEDCDKRPSPHCPTFLGSFF